ncbi:MAG: hypothetical protein WC679_02470 [Bacteroidales bacterium]|jgi:hypothetical protein
MQLFKLTWWATTLTLAEAQKQWPDTNCKTDEDVKILGDRYEFIGDAKSVWKLWYELTNYLNYPYVEVYSSCGIKCEPELGITTGMFIKSDTFWL